MSLEQWERNAWVKRVTPSLREVFDLIEIAEREIGDGSLAGISPDGRFDRAYDAIRCLADAALHASGYEVRKGERKHERDIQSLMFTVQCPSGTVDFFDQARRRRHQSIYERSGVAQQRDADDLLAEAKRLLQQVRDWLEREHPNLK
jgi:hypothetical protein